MQRNPVRRTESTTNVAGSGTFSSQVIDTEDPKYYGHQYMQAICLSSHTGTLKIDASDDDTFTAAEEIGSVAVAANVAITLKVPLVARYLRVRYVNGATLTTTFMLRTVVTAN